MKVSERHSSNKITTVIITTICRQRSGNDYEASIYTVVFYYVAKGGALRDYAYAYSVGKRDWSALSNC